MNSRRNVVQVYGGALLALLAVSGLTGRAVAAAPQQQRPRVQTAAMKFSKAAETWAAILADKKALGETVTSGKLDDSHDLAFSIRDGVVTLPYKSDALPPAKRKLLDQHVQAVAAIATEIDRVADAGDRAKAKAQYQNLVTALGAIESLYPANALPTAGARPMSPSEKELFLTPGGKYTAEDVEANGRTSSFQKYAGYVPSHNTEVKTGEPVCPISETRPDPKLTWIIGGKTYQFCCPPCIAEFVQKAKRHPELIQAPEAYFKK